MFRSHARSDCRTGPGRPTVHRGPLRPGSGPRRGGASRPPWPGISVARRPGAAAAGPAGRPPEFAGVQSWRHPFPMQHPQDGAGGTSKSTAIRRRLAPPPRILRIACTWLDLNFRGGPSTFPRLSHRDPGVTVERHPAAPLAGMGKSIPSCRVEINRVFQPPP